MTTFDSSSAPSLAAPDFWARGNWAGEFARLRREDPVSWQEEPPNLWFPDGGRGFWSVVRHQDVSLVSKDHESFTSQHGTEIPDMPADMVHVFGGMLNMGGQQHARYRGLVQRAFTPPTIEALIPSIQAHARQRIEKVADLPQADFMADLVGDFPAQIICDLMGVPAQDRDHLIVLTLTVLSAYGTAASYDATLQIVDYARSLIKVRQASPSLDGRAQLLERLLGAQIDGDRLSDDEIAIFFSLLVTAGIETTATAIGHGFYALSLFPDERRRWQADYETLAGSAFEEIIRWVSPVLHFRRTATRDVELHGKRIKAGDKVVMWYHSANHDETVFSRPDVLDLSRSGTGHVGFGGGGPHFCLGAMLARTEAQVFFRELFDRLPDAEVTGFPTYVHSNFVNGIETLPFTPGALRIRRPETAPSTAPVSPPSDTAHTPADQRPVRVAGMRSIAPDVTELRLTAADEAPLPAWTPGAHIDLVLPSGLTRQYSLCSDPTNLSEYRVAVLREVKSRGGSHEIHDTVRAGTAVSIRGPRNHFKLVPAGHYLFFAGGIGITPILAMATHAQRAGIPWRLVYGGRTVTGMAYRDELTTLDRSAVTFVPQDESGHPDIAGAIRKAQADWGDDFLVYSCGPEPMLLAVERTCDELVPHGTLHLERFGAASSTGAPDRSEPEFEFEVELRLSRRTLLVPADRRLIDVVRDIVPTVPFSCEEGYCGSCETAVLEGTPDHRDQILTEDERAANNTMMICVGRSCSKKLVLEI